MSAIYVMFVIVFLYGCIFGITSADNVEEERVLLERNVKSPWNVHQFSEDDIRCHCNLPVCITTNYMCRTARTSGGCFTEVHETYNTDAARRHGCVELLPDDDQRIKCDNSPRKHVKTSTSKTNTETLMLCCQEDLCNNKRPNLTSDIDGIPGLVSIGFQRSESQTTSDYNSDEFWFKVATIAVPVLGAIILVILIALAIRMLRNDNIEVNSKVTNSGISPRKIPYDYEANYNHSPLLKDSHNYMNTTTPATTTQSGGFHQNPSSIQISSGCCQTNQSHNINSDKKNETQAKINQLMHLEYSLLPQSCHDPNVKQTNTDLGINSMYRNVNLITSSQNKSRDISDKVYEKEVLNPVTVNWAGTGSSGTGM